MARIPLKKLTLRAFRIENPDLTNPHSGILGLLQQVLTHESTAASRRMHLMQKTQIETCWQISHGQQITLICLV